MGLSLAFMPSVSSLSIWYVLGVVNTTGGPFRLISCMMILHHYSTKSSLDRSDPLSGNCRRIAVVDDVMSVQFA
ncbi:hypothetical protein H4582DRAFT_2020968, partial [Lactarius indigo]